MISRVTDPTTEILADTVGFDPDEASAHFIVHIPGGFLAATGLARSSYSLTAAGLLVGDQEVLSTSSMPGLEKRMRRAL